MKTDNIDAKIDALNNEVKPYIGDFKSSYLDQKKYERECKKIARKARNGVAVRNLILSSYALFLALPFILGGSLGISTYHLCVDSDKTNTYYCYMDSAGAFEVIDYDIDDGQMFVKTPWEEKDGKIVRDIYIKNKTVKEKKIDKFLNTSWDVALAENNFEYVRTESNTEVSTLEEIDNNCGIVGCTLIKQKEKNDDEYNRTKSSFGTNFSVSLIVGLFIAGTSFGILNIFAEGNNLEYKVKNKVKTIENTSIKKGKELKAAKRNNERINYE